MNMMKRPRVLLIIILILTFAVVFHLSFVNKWIDTEKNKSLAAKSKYLFYHVYRVVHVIPKIESVLILSYFQYATYTYTN